MKAKGGHFLLLCLVSLYKPISVTGEAHNEETRLVMGIEGGNVTLQLNRSDVEDVSWYYDGHVRITTKPGEPIYFWDPNHKGNMLATEDASLVITNLSQEDQKEYSASLQLKGTQENYGILYDLKVYEKLSEEDIQLEHTTNDERCSVSITCKVKKPNVTVTWVNSSNLNVTRNVLCIEVACTSPSIACIAENPISNITKTVKPSELCRGKKAGGRRTTGNILLTVLLLIAVMGFAGFVYWKVKKRQSR